MTRISVGTRERVNFYFDKPMFDALRRLAGLKNTTYSELIRVAVREYLIRESEAAVRADKAIREIGT